MSDSTCVAQGAIITVARKGDLRLATGFVWHDLFAWHDNASARPGQDLQPHQAAVIAEAVRTALPHVPSPLR
jgi:hypothetical protein